MGTVLDADGKPVAGVVVKCESKRERFTNNDEFLTDRHGSFRFTNISDGAPVILKVMDARGVTESPLGIIVNSAESPVLRLVKATPKRMTGRIVDQAGRPIAGASVEVRQGKVAVAEGFAPAEYVMENAFDFTGSKRNRFITDANGRFETDPCIDWHNVFGLQVTAAEHYETVSWIRNVDKAPADEPTFDFGELVMHTLPATSQFTIQVQDKSGSAVSQAKVLFIQGRDFAGSAQADAQGKVQFAAKTQGGGCGSSPSRSCSLSSHHW